MRHSIIAATRAVTALTLICVSQAGAATISFSDSIPLRTTNWTGSVLLGKFNSDFGTLLSATITIDGHIEGYIRVESLDRRPSTVVTTLEARVTVTRPDFTTITAALPELSCVDNLGAFDGVLDFGGISGASHLGAFADASQSFTAPPPSSDLALFSSPGGGTITLPVSASGLSTVSGAGNLATLAQTFASATVTITYDYVPDLPSTAVPEPSTVISAGLGLVGLATARRRATLV